MAHSQTTKKRAIEMVLQGNPVTSVAKKLKLGRATVSKWVNTPEVKQMRAEVEERAHEHAAAALALSVDTAVGTLLDVCERGDTSASRVSAAKAILDRVGLVGGTRVQHSGSIELADVPTDELIARAERLRAELTGSDENEAHEGYDA